MFHKNIAIQLRKMLKLPKKTASTFELPQQYKNVANPAQIVPPRRLQIDL